MRVAVQKRGKMPYKNTDKGLSCVDKSAEMSRDGEPFLDVKSKNRVNFREYILRQCYWCEKQIRCYFCLDNDDAGVVDSHVSADVTTSRIIEQILNVQLTNFLYDTYIRFLMSGYQGVIVGHKSPVLACLKQALAKLDKAVISSKADSGYARLAQSRRLINLSSLQDVGSVFDYFTLMFDSARKNGSILSLDLVLPEYIDNLVYRTDVGEIVDNKTILATRVDRWGLPLSPLSIFQTLYFPRFDAGLVDHSRHHEQVYIPIYRFGDDAVAAMSMSSYIGNTMRRNIRMLYDFIATLLTALPCESRICPCVVIFNMFVRDYFRVYHSKSLPQTSFIQVCDEKNGKSIKISYMLIANKFPRISQWFNSINNQFVKKTGYARILHIDAYARLISNACEAALTSFKKPLDNKMKKNRQKKRIASKSTTANKRFKAIDSSNKKKGIARTVRFDLSAPEAGRSDSMVHSRKIGNKRKEKITLSHLFDASLMDLRPMLCKTRPDEGNNDLDRLERDKHGAMVLASLYRTGFSACQHRQVVRIYTQKRAHDENASLSTFCNDCHCYL